ncbi:MAG: hypothetical protein SH848_11285 [Saprospiraceae bacterium]|nr:hypothetical protein [Saprospiraceae bacterium]MDZ4704505.1 hypothetical protein [Saprospiraceae bacterium]
MGFLLYAFGSDTAKTVWFRATGEVVEGRISGFLAGRNSPSVQLESTGIRNGKRKARRSVFRYPVAEGATDSLEGRSGAATFFTFTQYDLHECVPVVFAKGKPQDAYLFGTQMILMNTLLSLFAGYMMSIGIRGKT